MYCPSEHVVWVAHVRSEVRVAATVSYSAPAHTVSGWQARTTVAVCGRVSYSASVQITLSRHTVSAWAVEALTVVCVASHVCGPRTTTASAPMVRTPSPSVILTTPVDRPYFLTWTVVASVTLSGKRGKCARLHDPGDASQLLPDTPMKLLFGPW